jgi:hypothetical protein
MGVGYSSNIAYVGVKKQSTVQRANLPKSDMLSLMRAVHDDVVNGLFLT